MASPNTLQLRELPKRHTYLPLRDEEDPRVLHTTSGSYFRHPSTGQIVFPEQPINGRQRKREKKRAVKLAAMTDM